jgi:hypothetical protein
MDHQGAVFHKPEEHADLSGHEDDREADAGDGDGEWVLSRKRLLIATISTRELYPQHPIFPKNL